MNAGEAESFEKVSAAKDLDNRDRLRVTVAGADVVLFKVDGEIRAVVNNCPHQHFAMLHEGEMDNGNLTCPMHGWTFDLRTGSAVGNDGRLQVLRVRVRGDEVWVEKPNWGKSFSMLF